MNAEFAVAVHSLVFLTRRGGTSTSEEIARSVCTHPARVRKVLSRLKKAQLVSSREGHQDGGYAAMCAAEAVTLLDVLTRWKRAWCRPSVPARIATRIA